MERKLKHPERGAILLSREGEIVLLLDSNAHVLDEKIFRTELTAKAYESFLLHYHADLGFKPYG